MYEQYYTTAEVALMEGVTIPIPRKWAEKNGVLRFSRYFAWTEKDIEAFKLRKKTPGPEVK